MPLGMVEGRHRGTGIRMIAVGRPYSAEQQVESDHHIAELASKQRPEACSR